jgi:hypothetical protein
VTEAASKQRTSPSFVKKEQERAERSVKRCGLEQERCRGYDAPAPPLRWQEAAREVHPTTLAGIMWL